MHLACFHTGAKVRQKVPAIQHLEDPVTPDKGKEGEGYLVRSPSQPKGEIVTLQRAACRLSVSCHHWVVEKAVGMVGGG
jgi:hypothetical protein